MQQNNRKKLSDFRNNATGGGGVSSESLIVKNLLKILPLSMNLTSEIKKKINNIACK